MRYSAFGVALAAAMTLFALNPGYAEPSQAIQTASAAATPPQATPAAAPAPQMTQAAATAPQVASIYPQSRLKPFDMKECYENRGCQLATCVTQLTAAGSIIICEGHGTSFP